MNEEATSPEPDTRSLLPRILVVDDDQSVHDVLDVLLGHEGYEVADLYDGDSAILEVKRHMPQGMILDLQMPGMNGVQVMKFLAEIGRVPPTVVFTGFPALAKSLPRWVRCVLKGSGNEELLISLQEVRRAWSEPEMREWLSLSTLVAGMTETLQSIRRPHTKE